jgi:hypothetical protein
MLFGNKEKGWGVVLLAMRVGCVWVSLESCKLAQDLLLSGKKKVRTVRT